MDSDNCNDSIIELANDWVKIDDNPVTKKQIIDLLEEKDFKKLNDLLSVRIKFGTAGLRSKMEAGFSRINDITILQTSIGLAEFILDFNSKNNITKNTIVIGHDHRFNSQKFAELTANCFLIKGFHVYFIGGVDDEKHYEENVVATPFVPFTIDHFKLNAGIMITASHNPKNDNGYKVYWKNGCQIIPPIDKLIESSILKNLDSLSKDYFNTPEIFKKHNDRLIYCRELIVSKYLNNLIEHLSPVELNSEKLLYNSMNGVGIIFVKEIFLKLNNHNSDPYLNFANEQCKIDPNFTTIDFPNPEEKGSLDYSLELADELNINLIVLNDPDADRFSVAIKTNEVWKQLSGNELGILFTDFVISNEILKNGNNGLDKVFIINSTVSTTMIKSMSSKLGFNFTETLTGFKWIGNKSIELESNGFKVPFAFEEAIGFMFNNNVHDKDGLFALVNFLKMYNYWINNNFNVLTKLESLYKTFGYFKQLNGYYKTSNDFSIIKTIFGDKIRKTIKNFENIEENYIDRFKIIYWRDLTTGYDSSTVDRKPELFVDESSEMITVELKYDENNTRNHMEGDNDDLIRFTVRNSGTEPKLKVYIEAKSNSEDKSIKLTYEVWNLLKGLWFEPEINSLIESV